MSDLSRDDLRELKDDILDRITGGFQGVHERLDGLNGRTRAVETKVAVLEDRGVRDPTARWGAGVGILGIAAYELIARKVGWK